MKSSPSLKPILAEFIAGLKPPAQHMEALRAGAMSRIYPTFMHQSRLILVVSMDLNKEIGGNIQPNFYETQRLVEHIHADEVLAPLEFRPYDGGQILRLHDFFCNALSRLISAFISAMPVTASSQSK